MASSYIFGEQAVRQISEALAKTVDAAPGVQGRMSSSRVPVFGQIEIGKLDTTMAKGGTATMSIYVPSTAGGIGTDTGENITIVDVDQMPAASSPLPSSTKCTVSWVRGAWCLISYECDAVA